MVTNTFQSKTKPISVSRQEEKAPIGARIRKARENAGISQGDLSRLIGLSGAASHISAYERGAKEPGATTVRRLAQALNVSADYLLTGTEREFTGTHHPPPDLAAVRRSLRKMADAQAELSESARSQLVGPMLELRRDLERIVAGGDLPGPHLFERVEGDYTVLHDDPLDVIAAVVKLAKDGGPKWDALVATVRGLQRDDPPPRQRKARPTPGPQAPTGPRRRVVDPPAKRPDVDEGGE